ncbi:MAG: hypothetical protein MO847_02915 [Candidatus Protistobacter heckmanni]|nr:hypothetical protein [Candidatus Protistobacter heckmanni]
MHTELVEPLIRLMTECISGGPSPRRTLLVCLLLSKLGTSRDCPQALREAAESAGDAWLELHRDLMRMNVGARAEEAALA